MQGFACDRLVRFADHPLSTRTADLYAFDIERQIDIIHQREVHLPSGGRLVIDQTEPLVAIDVNSGKSRSAKDSETNAYQTISKQPMRSAASCGCGIRRPRDP